MACELYCSLLPQCEALRICRSGFPIATTWMSKQYCIRQWKATSKQWRLQPLKLKQTSCKPTHWTYNHKCRIIQQSCFTFLHCRALCLKTKPQQTEKTFLKMLWWVIIVFTIKLSFPYCCCYFVSNMAKFFLNLCSSFLLSNNLCC